MDFHIFFSESKVRILEEKSGTEAAVIKESLEELERHEELLAEIVLCRVVDNFLNFIIDLISLIYKEKPEMLRSSEQEKIEFILQFKTMDELRIALAEKRVEKLSFIGFTELDKYLKESMGINLFEEKADFNRAALLIEYRNIYTHNKGIIGSISARRFKILEKHLGKKLTIKKSDVRELRQFLENAVMDIDIRAAKKFSLKSEKIPEPPAHFLE